MSLLLMLSMLGGGAWAADSGPVLSLAGGGFIHPEASGLENTWTGIVRPGWQLSPSLTGEIDLGYKQGNLLAGGNFFGMTPRANLLWFFLPDAAVQPFLAVGPGLSVVRNDWDNTTDTDLLLNAGPGLRVGIRDNLSLRADARFVANLGDGDDLANFEWSLGLMFHPAKVRDMDADGILDDADACVEEAEDMDGFEDSDGCPEADNDGDGVLDADDACPMEAEDMDDFEDSDGCPEADNDGDGLADADDECPVDAGPEGTRGCPDRDGDLVPDSRDKCPDKPRNPSVAPDKSNGCPAQRVVLGAKKIEILDKVFFETGSATIKDESHKLLDEVAEVLKENPRIKKVRVEGHTDNVGNPAFNKRLSQQRAEAVVAYLVEAGVDAGRLEAAGFGMEKPIADNATEEGRAKNRRVEFNILEQGKVRERSEEAEDSGRQRSEESEGSGRERSE